MLVRWYNLSNRTLSLYDTQSIYNGGNQLWTPLPMQRYHPALECGHIPALLGTLLRYNKQNEFMI